MNALPNDFSIEEIEIGQEASFIRAFSEQDVTIFAELSGDKNPLHIDEEYARTTRFGKRVVHGMLVASMCSKLVGMYLPGKKCLYLKQELLFKDPVFIGDELTVIGKVLRKVLATNMLEIVINIKRGDTIVLSGNALVQVIKPI